MNKCIFFGKLFSDPDVKYSANTQKAIVNFSIGVRRDYKNKEGKYESDFFNCVAFGKQGELIGNSFGKGSRICVWGAMRQEHWEDRDGNKRTTYRLSVEGFDFVDSASETSEKSKAEEAAQSIASTLGFIDDGLDDF